MNKRRTITLLLSLFLLISMAPSSFAESNVVSFGFCSATTVCKGDYCYIKMDKDMEKVVNKAEDVRVKSSDKSIIKPEDFDDLGEIAFRAKKEGEATLTVQAYKDYDEGVLAGTYEMAISVVPYSNPFKSVKIGKYQLKKYFNKATYKRYTLKKVGNKKVSVETQEGWTVKKMHYLRYGLGMKNKNSKTIKKASGKFSLKPTSKKYNQFLDIYISNPNYYNGKTQIFTVSMSSKYSNIS